MPHTDEDPATNTLADAGADRLRGRALRSGGCTGLEPRDELVKPDGYGVRNRFEPDRRLEVEVGRRTDQITSLEFDVGSAGDRAMASLFLRRVFIELRERGAYPGWFVEHEPGVTLPTHERIGNPGPGEGIAPPE